nr:hypothetical protein [Tanacetum cinerariifolium]
MSSTNIFTSSTNLVLAVVSLVDINLINSGADEEGRTTVVGCENDARIQKSNGLATLEKKMETRKETKDKIKEGTLKVDHGTNAMTVVLVRKREVMQEEWEVELHTREGMVTKLKNQLATQLQSMSTQLTLTNAIKCKLWHFKKSTIIALGTINKTDEKQIHHKKELLKDCYKVSIDTSLVDAACILDVGNNDFKTVKDAIGGFLHGQRIKWFLIQRQHLQVPYK